MKNTKKEVINSNPEFRTKCETLDKDSPDAIFINISSWVTPVYNTDFNYNLIIRNLRKKIKQLLYNGLIEESFYRSKPIVDLKLKESGIEYNKKSYMECEITLFQKSDHSLKELKGEIDDITDYLINNGFMKNPYFKYSSKK